MKADIDNHGNLMIIPESNAERLALKAWEQQARISVNDQLRLEDHYWTGSSVRIVAPQ